MPFIYDTHKLKMLSFTAQDNIAEREICGVPCKCTGNRGDRGGVGQPGSKVSYPKKYPSVILGDFVFNYKAYICFVFVCQGGPGLSGSQGHPGDEGGPVSLKFLFMVVVLSSSSFITSLCPFLRFCSVVFCQ